MTPTTEVHETALSPAPAPPGTSTVRKMWSGIKLVVMRSIFWAYPRGSWQYDLIVLAILSFIFLSPRAWFNDRPTLELANLRHLQGIVESSRVGKEVSYLVDARLVDTLNLKPEAAIPIILKQHLQGAFTVKAIDAVRDRHGVILGYTVMVDE